MSPSSETPEQNNNSMRGGNLIAGLPMMVSLATLSGVQAWNDSGSAITVDGTSFALHSKSMSYRFHVDDVNDLILDHHGGPAYDTLPTPDAAVNGWVGPLGRNRREYPDSGRGDFREPAIQIKHPEGHTVSDFQYTGHDVVNGKPGLTGLPATFGSDDDVSTLVVHLYDNYSSVALDLSYSVFGEYDAVVRSVQVRNDGAQNVTLLKVMSWSEDFPVGEWDMVDLHGDWAREAHKQRRRVGWGLQGAQSSTGYSSHLHNPFLALLDPSATEHSGEVYGFSLIYTGSHAITVERGSQGYTRAQLGINPIHLDWSLGPGDTFATPECISVYSSEGLGGMSRKYHSLIRKHLIKSQYATADRPVLLNSWEGLAFDYNESRIVNLAQESADLGIKLFVLDDGWFGDEYPRDNDTLGLGDWIANPAKFPDGIPALVDQVTGISVANSSDKLRFGLWFEPEMVNPNSTLYHEHPDWVLSAGSYPRTERRNQLVLNLALPEVQQFCIDSVSNILGNASISYVKWDNNRGMHELPTPSTMHAYMLGMYHVFDTLTSRYPDVLWEGCASGGGRFDGGVLQYFPQIWTSDDTDGLERLYIQFGTSLVYPPSAMGGHVSEVPNQQTGRTTPLEFRAHVAMMTGSFGFELDPAKLEQDERDAIPGLVALGERVNPIVVQGDMWRLQLPEDSNWPAAMFITQDGSQAVLFYFQVRGLFNAAYPRLRLRGLDAGSQYEVEGLGKFGGASLMNQGIAVDFEGDYDSRIMFITRQ